MSWTTCGTVSDLSSSASARNRATNAWLRISPSDRYLIATRWPVAAWTADTTRPVAPFPSWRSSTYPGTDHETMGTSSPWLRAQVHGPRKGRPVTGSVQDGRGDGEGVRRVLRLRCGRFAVRHRDRDREGAHDGRVTGDHAAGRVDAQALGKPGGGPRVAAVPARRHQGCRVIGALVAARQRAAERQL